MREKIRLHTPPWEDLSSTKPGHTFTLKRERTSPGATLWSSSFFPSRGSGVALEVKWAAQSPLFFPPREQWLQCPPLITKRDFTMWIDSCSNGLSMSPLFFCGGDPLPIASDFPILRNFSLPAFLVVGLDTMFPLGCSPMSSLFPSSFFSPPFQIGGPFHLQDGKGGLCSVFFLLPFARCCLSTPLLGWGDFEHPSHL